MPQRPGSRTGRPWMCNCIIFMLPVLQLVDVRGILPSFQNPLGIAPPPSSAGLGTEDDAMPLPVRAILLMFVPIAQVTTELVSVRVIQQRRSAQLRSTMPLPHLMVVPAASPAVHDCFDFCSPRFIFRTLCFMSPLSVS